MRSADNLRDELGRDPRTNPKYPITNIVSAFDYHFLSEITLNQRVQVRVLVRPLLKIKITKES